VTHATPINKTPAKIHRRFKRLTITTLFI